MLFHEVIFGPVRSRRLGMSLGINLLPTRVKHCSFNCVYCECGWTKNLLPLEFIYPSRHEVESYLEARVKELIGSPFSPDSITFAGNGEPTMHPEFAGIVDDTIRIRDQYLPGAIVSVLSNATMLSDTRVFNALKRIDNNILKLDTVNEEMFRLLNRPLTDITPGQIIKHLMAFEGRVIIQTMFIKGEVNGVNIDNTTSDEVKAWIAALKDIHPQYVMLYSLDRAAPVSSLIKINKEELETIAAEVRKQGIDARVYA